MKVKAAIARERGQALRFEPLELDEPRSDEILVRLVASGVSSADLDAIDGRLPMPMPFVPGCEGAGIVERIGDAVTHVEAGDSVVVSYAFCGHCENCLAGRPRACTDFGALNLSGRRLDGSTPFSQGAWDINGNFFGQSSFATHLLCRASNVVGVPADAPLEVLASLGGELLLGAGTILHGFRIRSDDSLLVMGADAVGLVATMTAKAKGVSIIVVADADERRRHQASELGATVTLHPDQGVNEVVRSILADGVRFGLETTGLPAARKACLESLSSSGTCAMMVPSEDQPVDFDDQAEEGRPLVLSVDGHAPPATLVPEIVRLQSGNSFPIGKLVDFFPFERVNDAIDALRNRRVAKPILRFRLDAFGDLDRAKAAGASDEASGHAKTSASSDANQTDVLVKP